jgi:hypothetical protein
LKLTALAGTPTVNGPDTALMTVNPNLNPANLPEATNPFCLDRSQAATSDRNRSTTDIGDADPLGDVCSTTTGEAFSMTGTTIGDLLKWAGVTWASTRRASISRHQREWDDRLQEKTTSLITHTNKGRLHSAPRAISVLQIHGQSDSCPALIHRHDRPDGRRQSPARTP